MSQHLLSSTQEYAADVAETAIAAKTDFNFLAALADPTNFFFKFPAFYLALFTELTSFRNKIERFAIGIPRGFAKTTFIKLLCLWYILFSGKSFILIVCASEKKAINILSDVCDLLSSPNIRAVFGRWDVDIEVDQQTTKVFRFRGRNIVLWAAGAGTSVRGINRKNQRPDVIIMDDIQEREDAKNEELAKELTSWMLSTLMKARSNFGCTYIFVGNMYPQNSILAKLKTLPQWTSLIVGGILADGTSLWEELKPIDELLEEYEMDTAMGQPEVFISEILNATDLPLASGLELNKIPHMPEYFNNAAAEASFIIIDPSAGKKTSDDLTIEHYSIVDGHPIFDELHAGTFTPLETIELAIKMGIQRNTRVILVEDVAYQSTLLFWFNFYCDLHQIHGFEFHPLSPKGRLKNNRIKQGAIRVIKGEIYLHPKVRSLVISQYESWDPTKTNNKDDIIDPIGYVDEAVREYGHLMIRQVFDADSTANITASDMGSIGLPF